MVRFRLRGFGFRHHEHWSVCGYVQELTGSKKITNPPLWLCVLAGYSCHTDSSLLISGRLFEEGEWAGADHRWSDVEICSILRAPSGLPRLGVVLQGCHLLPVRKTHSSHTCYDTVSAHSGVKVWEKLGVHVHACWWIILHLGLRLHFSISFLYTAGGGKICT